MSVISERSSHISWLTAKLANNRTRIIGLLQRMTGLGSVASAKTAIFVNFSHWLDEVAAARTEEMELMTRIENMERRHCDMRAKRKLKRVRPRAQSLEDHDYCNDNVKRPRQLLLAMLWYLFLRQKINQKKQGLTAN